MKKKLLITSLLVLSTHVFALIPASISNNKISANETLSMTISLPNSSSKPNLAPLNQDFQIVGTASSSSTSIINGSMSSENKLIISLIPKKAGRLTIPTLAIGNDHTQSFTVEVVAGNNIANNQQASLTTGVPATQGLLFKTSVDTTNGYVGVPIDLTMRLYYAVNISGVSIQPIVIDGIHVETDGKNKQYQTTENGHPYMVVEQHFTLTPTRTGTITIPALTSNGRIDSNPNNITMISIGQPFSLQSKPITLNIKEIPNHIDPTKWLPATNVSVTDNWSNNTSSAIAGDPITRTITINATDIDANSIPELEFESINGVNIYPEKAQKIINTQSGKHIGSKSFKIVYIPNQNGQVIIPEINIPWWNLTTNKEETIHLESKIFNVGGAIAEKILTNTEQNQIESSSNNSASTTMQNKVLYVIIGSVLVIILGAAIFYISRRKKSKGLTNIVTTETKEQKITPIVIDKAKNNSINELNLAIATKNIQQINQALIDWANDRYATKIYSISQIKQMANDDNLSVVIDNLTAALYNNQTFTQFDELTQLIAKLSEKKIDKPNKNKINLANLYPDLYS